MSGETQEVLVIQVLEEIRFALERMELPREHAEAVYEQIQSKGWIGRTKRLIEQGGAEPLGEFDGA